MRVVLDTNVVVSGVFFGGQPGRILTAWSEGQFALVLSPAILDEYRRVGQELGRRYQDTTAVLDPILTLMAMHAVIVDAPSLDLPVSDDPDDDKFLAAAASARAEIIVSGDRDLLRVSGWNDITVLTPRQFADRHLPLGPTL
ncbi:MAG: putative toxin-antitoxin system toxin component, PIN family [Gemmatimonadaceae bacterium]